MSFGRADLTSLHNCNGIFLGSNLLGLSLSTLKCSFDLVFDLIDPSKQYVMS